MTESTGTSATPANSSTVSSAGSSTGNKTIWIIAIVVAVVLLCCISSGIFFAFILSLDTTSSGEYSEPVSEVPEDFTNVF